MCGIVGIVTRDGSPPNKKTLDIMLKSLGHRGPDGKGLHKSQGVHLAQNRLAIIDLLTGDQPFYESNGAVIIANAEIYNYVELKRELTEYQFSTSSDCEPPLYLYRKFGIDFANKLRGMYAIAIYDTMKKCLILSRDPFGIKPLYYCKNTEQFVFASEARALLDAGFGSRKIVDLQKNQLLQLQFTCGRQTIFQGIHRVLPGETLLIRNGKIVERRHLPIFPVCPSKQRSYTSFEDALVDLDRTLEEAVSIHQRSDVPYGLFLSGGIDSSAVLALMARLNNNPVRTYTVGFSGAHTHDERALARTVANSVGADHREVEFNEQDFWNLLPKIAASIDDPAADYAILPTWKLARLAAQDVKVVLTGEGGDELFGGYGRYRSRLRPWWLGGRDLRPRGIFNRHKIFQTEPYGWRDSLVAAQSAATLPNRTPLQIAQATDCADWLPNDLLTKLDRCLMNHGLEGRTPFLDKHVAHFAFTLPDKMKIKNNLGKWLLRQWLDRVMPMAQPFEKKRGFTVPVGEWIRRRGSTLGPLIARHPSVSEFCRAEYVENLFNSKKKGVGIACWVLLFYALWYQSFILKHTSNGDVIEALREITST